MSESARPPVDADFVQHRLAELGINWPRPSVVATTGSTNADLMDAARRGAPEGTVIVSDEQTAGRGRLGRAWISAPGAGLWMSVLVGQPSLATLGLLPLTAGVAVAKAARALGVAAGLKWPNDVVMDDGGGLRKLAGILCESDGTGGVVVGIGVNVSQAREQLPVPQATSMAIEGVAVSRSDLVVAILARLHAGLADLRSSGGETVMAEYRALCVTTGRAVTASLPGGKDVTGIAQGIADDGRLVISEDGNSVYVAAGDVIHATI